MKNPFFSIKRLFEGAPDARRSVDLSGEKAEKNFMKFDLTADMRF